MLTNARLQEMNEARKAADKMRRQLRKQSKADHERKVVLVGEAVLLRVDRGEMDEAEFQMMDEALSRADDRALFGLD
jgi:hypothetical protein